MADIIRIDAGVKRLQINDGPDFLQFNPSDVAFVEKFYLLIENFEAKLVEYQQQAEMIDAETDTGENGLPVNLGKKISFMGEVCDFAHEQIDILFGEGTSSKLFDGMKSLDMVEQFFEGIAPFIAQERDEKLRKYTGKGGKTLK